MIFDRDTKSHSLVRADKINKHKLSKQMKGIYYVVLYYSTYTENIIQIYDHPFGTFYDEVIFDKYKQINILEVLNIWFNDKDIFLEDIIKDI